MSNAGCFQAASKKARFAAEQREMSKNAKYRDLARNWWAELLVAAVETGGAFGAELKQLISRMGYLFKTSGRDLVPGFGRRV